MNLGEKSSASYIIKVQIDSINIEPLFVPNACLSILIQDRKGKRLDAYEAYGYQANSSSIYAYMDSVKNLADSFFKAGGYFAREINRAFRKEKK